MHRIAVLTSGGDAPGMNACIRAVVRTALYNKIEVFGVERGYQGLIAGNIRQLDSHSVSNIIQRGGTILKTARCAEFHTAEGRKKAHASLVAHDIDGLVVIGGNGTYTGAKYLSEEYEIKIVGLPGTIDNDLFGTDFTIGYDTAINTALGAIDKIRDTADSHDRIFFVEVMGKDSGFIAMDVGISGGAEAVLIPETETDIVNLTTTLEQGWGRQKSSQLIIVAEGDQFGGVEGIVEQVKSRIPALDCRILVLGHIQRGGSPTARDRVLASRLGAAAVEGLKDGRNKTAIGVVNNHLQYVTFDDAISKRKPITKSLIALAEILST
ncbi:MAG: 6-phosphofructokinase [Bacteroidota bacterium]|nr:6-phosphofructokinase [Bacteroidota bacterium]